MDARLVVVERNSEGSLPRDADVRWLEAIGLDPQSSCAACWTGNYPTLIAGGEDTIDPTDGDPRQVSEAKTNAAP